jgi:enamine deaminase RidA (YjgF/YER057c/UK114 family)
MKKRLVNPPTLPPPRGFTHGIVTTGGSLLFLAGQAGTDATGRIADPDDFVKQCARALQNLEAVVVAAGGGMQDIVKLDMFVRSREQYQSHLKPLGRVFRSFFHGYWPTMALFEVAGFAEPDALVELEGLAVLPTE